MSNVPSIVQTSIENEIVNIRWVCYLDVDTDPDRVVSAPYDKTFSGTGDSDLDGETYTSLLNNLIDVSEVKHDETGSSQVNVRVSGLVVNDASFLALIGDKTKWQGRTARLWWYVVDDNEAQIGGVYPYYTGYMNDVTIKGDSSSQVVEISIENYLVSIFKTGAKTYQMQKEFDPSDNSAAASLAAANGNTGSNVSINAVAGPYYITTPGKIA